jgi:hypothetical protein
MQRTRLGKTVGSCKPPLEAWTYWQEGARWVTVAPSGARMAWFGTEAEAKTYADEENRKRDQEP